MALATGLVVLAPAAGMVMSSVNGVRLAPLRRKVR
jgi:hypothetical protein